MHSLPPIRLDTTLAELYAQDSTERGQGQIALVLCAANSDVAPTSNLARNTKFLYQDSTFSSTSEGASPSEERELQRTVAVKYLSLVPQHDAFAAGNMHVILFNLDSSEACTARGKEEALQTISSLIPLQRPRLLFFSSPKHIAMRENGIDRLVPKMALDELEGLPLALDLETHYFLNSKVALCQSGLPSPDSVLLELDDYSVDPRYCCDMCRSDKKSLYIPSNCTGIRGEWLKSQITRIMSKISAQQLPFVLKNQQTFGGGGTFVVSTHKDLSELQSTLSNRLLPKLLSQVNSSNAHLKPASLILSELIKDPIGDWGLTFFVTKAGQCIFISLTQQVVDSTKAWIGSTISYTAQGNLKQKFTPIMRKIGSWLSKYGYYGPCGADILETALGDNNSDGPTMLYIVDLNVRTSGSLVLGLMSDHFSEQRGLHEASSFSINVDLSRESFVKRFESQFEEGKMVIVSWYEDPDSGLSFGNLVIGAENKQSLESQIKRVKELASEIHF